MKPTLKAAAVATLLLLFTLVLLSPWANARKLRRLAEQSTVVATRRGPVEYAETGSGPAVLVFHGTPGGFDSGLAAARSGFIDGYRVISPSRPGYLRSPLGPMRTVADQADKSAALLDALGVPRVTVWGFSGGGPFALEFAARHPERCRKLILTAAISRGSKGKLSEWTTTAMRLTDLATWWALPLMPDIPVFRILRSITPIAPREAGWRNDFAIFNTLPEEYQGRIFRPTLILHGTADTEVEYAQSADLVRRIPTAELIAIQGATHLSLYESPQARQAIRAFLEH
jgi:pimeloyl-ACP methyl ester carboxylesterase